MPFIHGQNAEFELNAVDLSAFMNSITFNPGSDSHDVTTYGQTGHVFAAGLTNGTMTIEGVYSDDAAGPAKTIYPLVGAAPTTFAYRPQGSGSGLPERAGNAQVTSYQETTPVAGMISWTASLQISGAVTDTDLV